MIMTYEEEYEPGPDSDDDDDPASDPIEIGPDEARVADDAIEKLTRAKNLYQRSGQLVRIVLDAPTDKVLVRAESTPRIIALTRANLRELISEHACFVRGHAPAHVPDQIVRAIHERAGDWERIRRLRTIVDTPVLRADGTIIDRDGYDDATELLYYSPETVYPSVPDAPTHDDAVRARDALLHVVCDFPFATEAHRSAWLAGLLTPFARYAFEGPAPLTAIDKNVRGAGGTLLADVIGMIVSGRPMPRMVAAKNAEEERKRITAIARSGDPIVLLDNVSGTLGTDALDAALTGTTWSDRLLGTNDHATYPLDVVWFATGNNIDYGADTLRRVMHVRIESPEERPEERTGFVHPDLLAWVRAERPRLVVAALTMLRAYCVADRPRVGLVPWGSYEAWSSLVRGAVVWSGLPDPGITREALTSSADGERNALYDLLRAWRAIYGDRGATIAQALRDIEKANTFDARYTQLRSALAELCPTARADALPSARALAARLKSARGRVVGGLALDMRTKGKTGVPLVVREVSKGDSGDAGDSVLVPLGSVPHLRAVKAESPESPESPRRRLRRRSEAT